MGEIKNVFDGPYEPLGTVVLAELGALVNQSHYEPNDYAERQYEETQELRQAKVATPIGRMAIAKARLLDAATDKNEALDILKAEGECRGYDPSIFYPETKEKGKAKVAKEICKACHLQEACLEYALMAREKYGIWGGTSERARKRIQTQRRLAVKPAA